MSSTEFLGHSVWRTLVPLASDADRIQAAVAYIGSSGDDLLPLGAGSQIVVDASDAALSSGATDPRVLETWLGRGVDVRSLEGLHAKMLVLHRGPTVQVVVGSANASRHSESDLAEAALLTSNERACDAAVQQFAAWFSQGTPATPEFLERARGLYKERRDRLPAYRPAAVRLNRDQRMWLSNSYRARFRVSPEVLEAVETASAEAGDFIRVFSWTMDFGDERDIRPGHSVVLIHLAGESRNARANDWVDGPALVVDVIKRPRRRPVAILALDDTLGEVRYREVREALYGPGLRGEGGAIHRPLEGADREAVEALWPDLYDYWDNHAW